MAKFSVDKGKRAELAAARYLEAWWPEAARMVVTGYRTSRTAVADTGDLRGLPFTVQVKDHTGTPANPLPPLSDVQVARFLDATRAQADAAGHVVGVLLEKRRGKASPGDWWAHLDAFTLSWLLLGRWFNDMDVPTIHAVRGAAFRLRLEELVPLLSLKYPSARTGQEGATP